MNWRKLAEWVTAIAVFFLILGWGVSYRETQLAKSEAEARNPGAARSAEITAPAIIAPSSFSPSSSESPNPAQPTAPASPTSSSEQGALPAAPAIATDAAKPAQVVEEAPKAVALEGKVVILGYHQFCPAGQKPSNAYTLPIDRFAAQLEYLKSNNYQIVSLGDLRRFLKGEIPLSHRSACITISGGHRSVADLAAPLLKKEQLPWSFFVPAERVGKAPEAVDWSQLKALVAEGVEIGSNGQSPEFLTQRGKRSEEEYKAWLQDQLKGSKETLEKELGGPVAALVYPFGDWNEAVAAQAKEAGYELLLGVAANAVAPGSQADRLGRFVLTTDNQKNFESYLRYEPLEFASLEPAAGSVLAAMAPSFRAVLDAGIASQVDPTTFQAEVLGVGNVPVEWNAEKKEVVIRPSQDLKKGMIRMRVRAKKKDTAETCLANWHVYLQERLEAPRPPEDKIGIVP